MRLRSRGPWLDPSLDIRVLQRPTLVQPKVPKPLQENPAEAIRSCVCFKELGETIADARRAGDVDKSMEIIAETMKLIGNSLYGRCIMNKETHISMTYANKENVTKKINDPHFKDLNEISDNSYEVFLSKCKN